MQLKKAVVGAIILCATSHPGYSQDIVAQGQAVFNRWCVICHDRGSKYPGTQALEILYDGTVPAALADRTDLDGDVIRHVVHNGTSIMPFFRPTEISEDDMTALISYLTRNNE